MTTEEAIKILDPETSHNALVEMMGGTWNQSRAMELLQEAQRMGLQALREKQAGQMIELPFVAMIEQSLQKGKMTPMRDQRFNGRYAVVYVDKEKWGSPLIDICGTHYRRDEAEERRDTLTHWQPLPEPPKKTYMK